MRTPARAIRRHAPLLLAALLAGCSGLAEKIDGSIAQSQARASALAGDTGRSAAPAGAAPAPAVVREDGIWIGRSVVRLGARPLPPIFQEPATFDRTVHSLSELAERLTLRSGIPVKVAPDVLGAAGSPASDDAGSAPAAAMRRPGVPRAAPRPPERFLPAPAAATQPVVPSGPVRITYSNGNFKGLLDTAAARFGVSWKYEDGVIRIFHTEVRTFQISAVPGDSVFTANVSSGAASTGGTHGGGQGGGGGGGGGSSSGVSANNTQNTTVASRLSAFVSIENAIKAMLSTHGRAVASPATGAITVVDTPESLDRIAAYVENENRVLSRQVVVNVTVLSVSLQDNDEYGINWDLVYNTLNREYGVSNRFAAPTGATAFSASVIGGGRFAGSSVVIDALSRQGKVRRQTTASVVTLNNQPVPVQVARQTSYLQSASTSVVAQVGTVASLTPGTVTAGFNMSILPHVLGNGTVLLQFSGDLSTLRDIRPITSGGTTIEMPELDTRNFLQRVSMKSNETLIISGFEQTDENLDNRGVGHPRNFLFGGGRRASSNKEVIVILITPQTVSGT